MQPHCRECGDTYTRHHPTALFCGPACRKRFNNRRMVRGAELYDLVMAWRFERNKADDADMRGLIGRVAAGFRAADKARRAGRKSWLYDKGVARIPLGYGATGDGR